MYNFGELKEKVAVLVQRSGDTDYLTKIGIWLQLSHKQLADIYDYWTDLNDIHNFTSVANREAYQLPTRFDKPLRLFDLTNKIHVLPETEEIYTENNLASIAAATSGKPTKFRIYGVAGVTVQISSTGDTVKVKSSSSSDNGTIVIRIQGYIDSSNLIEDFENISISTSSPTSFVAGTKVFYKITHVSKSTNTTGYITIANSAETTLETLAPNERIARHKVLKLGLIPAGVYSYRTLFKQTVTEMVNDYDYPFTECDRYLIMDALGWALKQDTKDQAAEFAWSKASEALKILLMNQNTKLGPDYIHKITSQWLQNHRNPV